jgi:secreted PhoX family phosphatase
MICALTNNKEAGNYFGSILRIEERDGDHKNLEFQARTWMVGGPDTGFACPDNFAFDRKGNLWMTNDIADPDIGKGVYSSFGNNSLFYIPMSGPNAGEPFRVASAPIEAEFTGPCFADDGTLLISVQHPGNLSNENNNATSHWPGGGKSTPHPAVISIHGDLLNRLLT